MDRSRGADGRHDGGLQAFCDHFRDTFNSWWDDLGQIHLTDEVIETLVAGIREEAGGQSPSELAARRDAMIVALQRALGDLRRSA